MVRHILFKSFLRGKEKPNEENKNETVTTNAEITGAYEKGVIYSPLQGKAIALETVSDPVFSAGNLGIGLAIEPEHGLLYAPVNGVIQALFPTNHAVGITSEDGVELLLHVGIDTVELNGEGFLAYVKLGDMVTMGQKLLKFDLETVKAHGLEATTMIVVSNYRELGCMKILASGEVKPAQPIIRFES